MTLKGFSAKGESASGGETRSYILEGKALAAKIQQEISEFLAKNKALPKLTAIEAGDNASSRWYVDQQDKTAKKIGLGFERVTVKSQSELEEKIRKYNSDEKTHGIFITMPLPLGFDADKALLLLDARKDVEGIHPTSLGLLVLRKTKLIPPTAFAALRLIEAAASDLKGKRATIVGQSAIVGRPLQLLLGERRVTTIICNTGTPESDIRDFVSSSDIVVACAGKPGLVKGSWIKQGAIVIDIGTTEVAGKLVGDVEFEEAKKRAGFITPVPGGVGPLTVTMLMQNLITAYKWQKESM